MLKQILQGMVVGIANIIPGVSGGTMMVAMGLYDHLIHAITHLKSEFKKSMKLLIPIFLGAGIAIVVLSRLFEYLLEVYPIPTNFAFCGLIAGSLPFIFDLLWNRDHNGAFRRDKWCCRGCELWGCQCDQIIPGRSGCGCNNGSAGGERIDDADAARIL